ncbi:MAG: DNA-formamidopyrimidine glycosylase, partial [Deltaproteobacteria bacterium]|nr:DNA-formamidopyrimidine glycosylase [Deltaproteobacteria bacterium]
DPGRRRVANTRILGVHRSGKQVVFDLARGRRRTPEIFLAVHLRMTGRLIWIEHGGRSAGRARAELVLDRGRIVFIDTRRFGTIRIHDDLAQLGPRGLEPLSDELTSRVLGELIGRSSQPVKAWLLRQDRLVGIGNIYASEILFSCRIDPRRAVGSLTRSEVSGLQRAVRSVLRRAIECCGTTFSDFQDARGQTGGFARLLKVYGRQGEPCRRCRGEIARIVQQQRSTFFCSDCQR